jgi:hypothetical protein
MELRACGGQDSKKLWDCPTAADGDSGCLSCCEPKQAAPSGKRRMPCTGSRLSGCWLELACGARRLGNAPWPWQGSRAEAAASPHTGSPPTAPSASTHIRASASSKEAQPARGQLASRRAPRGSEGQPALPGLRLLAAHDRADGGPLQRGPLKPAAAAQEPHRERRRRRVRTAVHSPLPDPPACAVPPAPARQPLPPPRSACATRVTPCGCASQAPPPLPTPARPSSPNQRRPHSRPPSPGAALALTSPFPSPLPRDGSEDPGTPRSGSSRPSTAGTSSVWPPAGPPSSAPFATKLPAVSLLSLHMAPGPDAGPLVGSGSFPRAVAGGGGRGPRAGGGEAGEAAGGAGGRDESGGFAGGGGGWEGLPSGAVLQSPVGVAVDNAAGYL